ncbi:MAG: C4-dicarboxylate transporter DcuC [Verrucomicrobia bacterium]|nr:C4-dicarboxylate transporter DcuC [Verrucomicrobiota bacterium]
MQFPAALLIIALAMWCLVKKVEVRLTLFAAGLALASLAAKPLVVFEVFLAEMGNGKTIGPICSAMGYAYVLRAAGADRELVQLLLAPARRRWWLLIPGGCLTGFIANIAVTSQTACAAAVGPILVPLMLAAGYPAAAAAATLALGCSGGGSLYNPGDADLVAIHESSGAPMKQAMGAMFWPLLGGFVTAVAVFALITKRQPREGAAATAAGFVPPPAAGRRWKALLPPLPMLMIFALLPGVMFSTPPAPFEKGLPVSHAMILSTIIVLLLCRDELTTKVKAFFEGLGYAYANIISLIVTASCFIAGMTQVGLTEKLVNLVSGTGLGGKLAAGFFPGALGVITGSGIGPSVAFSKAVLPALRDNLPAALDLGTLAAIAATFGRTMSPAAAVVIFSANHAGVPATEIVKRTAPPLFAGFAVVLLLVIVRG